MPAGLGTLFAGLLLIVLAFVEGSSVWKALHEVLFGLFGCGSFVLAILYTRGEDLIGQMFKLMLGLVFASGTVIVFSEIPADIPAARMVAECYQNGVHAWLGGGAIGALLGGNLLLLCGRPAANLVMVVLALCASLYIFDITPAELWQWMCELGGSAHEKGVAVYEQNAARRAERQAARQAEEEAAALEAGDEPDLCDEEDEEGGFAAPGWLSGIFSWGHKVTKELEGEAVPEPVDDSLGYEAPAPSPAPAPAEPQEAPAFTPVQVGTPHPRASFDIDLGPDSTPVVKGGSEPIEPFIVGPGGTFGQDPLHKPAPRPIVKPVVPDAIETAAEDFFAKPEAPAAPEAPAPVVTPGIPAQPVDEDPAEAPAFDGSGAFQTPTLPTTDEPSVPVRVMADNVMAMRSAPDEDGWISITSEPVEEKDINTLVAAAMEKPAVGEQQAATAPAEEPEPEESYQYQYPGIDLFEKAPEESDPNAQDELKANAQKLVDTLESFGVRTRVLDISRGPSVTRYEVQPMAGVKISRITSLAYPQRLREPGLPADDLAPRHRTGQGHRRCGPGGRPVQDAPPAHCRQHRQRQIRLCQQHHHEPAVPVQPGGRQAHPHRPQGGRAGRVQRHPSPADAGYHRAEKGGGRSEQRRAGDGAPVSPVCGEQRPRHQVLQQAGRHRPHAGKDALHRHHH